ncbi:S1 RNA-binding domain-containing protein [Paludicola sp. MB14-C6]|uniref:S1 RNA-binding domain-containing protein n=1 Tax=Paludihabitans sp. MB14-C6 TaxID=3070656 RepID=UPI0027DC06BE|nr:S1 RNA-binding domain-containing protein [Paludicola sp. MB14-C6]WMJ23659.1 S1 RNA-binding domain-containing protein [Paludicola sp. MB14-C6]
MQHEIGKIVEGKVTGITKFGAFVELEDGAVGMVHISEVSQTYVNDISEHLKDQQKVTVKILNISDDGKISLSIKKAMPQQQAAPQRRENNNRPSDFNNRNAGNSRPPRQNNNYNKSAQQSNNKPASFEDMLSKFIQSSDEKISDLKRDKNTRRGSNHKKPNHDYDY